MQSSMSKFLLPSKLKSFLVLTPIKSKYQMMKASYAIFVYVIWQENPLVIDWFKCTVPFRFFCEIDCYKFLISKIALHLQLFGLWNLILLIWAISVISNLANSEYQMLPIWHMVGQSQMLSKLNGKYQWSIWICFGWRRVLEHF